MPCWQHEAELATLSNTWFLCDRCREAMRFAGDVAVALEHDTKASTSEGELADSLPKAGSGLAETLFVTPQSPPPGARPERDPAQDLPAYPIVEGEDWTLACTERVETESA